MIVRFPSRLDIFSRFTGSALIALFLVVFILVSIPSKIGFSESVDISKRIFLSVKLFLVFPVVLWSFYEIFRLRNSRLFPVFLFSLLALSPCFFFFFTSNFNKTDFFKYFFILIVVGSVIYFLANCMCGYGNFFDDSIARKQSFRKLSLLAFVFWNSLMFVSLILPVYILICLLLLVIFNDVLAYFVGSLIGRKKVFVSSPNKTLEGFIIPPLCLSCIMWASIVLLSNSSINLLNQTLSGHLIPVFSLLFLFMANAGDLVFSFQKRIFKIKDYSRLFAGQGGFWDRFDSHTFSLLSLSLFSFILILTSS